MTDVIEDAIVSAALAKGYAINSAVMGVVAVDLAGATLAGDMINLPGKGALSIQSYLRDLQNRAPSGFSRRQHPGKPDSERTVSELRRKRPLDSAWHDRHAKATGITKVMMDQIMRSRA